MKRETCQQCKDEQFKRKYGFWPNGMAFNRWAMWGCTCTPEAEAEALATFDLYTR